MKNFQLNFEKTCQEKPEDAILIAFTSLCLKNYYREHNEKFAIICQVIAKHKNVPEIKKFIVIMNIVLDNENILRHSLSLISQTTNNMLGIIKPIEKIKEDESEKVVEEKSEAQKVLKKWW